MADPPVRTPEWWEDDCEVPIGVPAGNSPLPPPSELFVVEEATVLEDTPELDASSFDWGSSGSGDTDSPGVDDLIRESRFSWRPILAGATALLLVAGGAGWWWLGPSRQPVDPTPTASASASAAVASLRTGSLPAGQVAPGFSSVPAWKFSAPAGSKMAGTPLGLVVVSGQEMSVYAGLDGARMLHVELDTAVDALTSGVVDDVLSLVWLSDGQVWWWAPGGRVHSAKAAWANEVSSAGGQVLVSGPNRTAVPALGGLAEVALLDGEVAMGSTAKGVVVASATGLSLLDADTGERGDIKLAAPSAAANRPVRWAGVDADHVLVVWSPVPSPTPAQQVLVALHSLDGTITSATTMTYQTASAATWMRTMGQQVGTFQVAAWDLASGKVQVECASCQLAGGFGKLISASDAGVAGFVSGQELFASELKVLAVAGNNLLVRDGVSVQAFPPTG